MLTSVTPTSQIHKATMLVLLVVGNYRKQKVGGLKICQLIKALVGRWWYHKSYFSLTGSICSSYASALPLCRQHSLHAAWVTVFPS